MLADDLDEESRVLNDAISSQPRDEYQCSGPCGRILPLTAEYFHRDPKTENGFHQKCKECVNNQRQATENKSLKDVVEQYQQQLTQTLLNQPNLFEALGTDAQLLEALMNAFGGTEGFSRMVLLQYMEAKGGGLARNQLLLAIMRFHSHVMKRHDPATKDLGQFTEDELNDEIDSRIKEIMRNAGYLPK